MLCPEGCLSEHDAVPPTCIHFDMALNAVFWYVYFEHTSSTFLQGNGYPSKAVAGLWDIKNCQLQKSTSAQKSLGKSFCCLQVFLHICKYLQFTICNSLSFIHLMSLTSSLYFSFLFILFCFVPFWVSILWILLVPEILSFLTTPCKPSDPVADSWSLMVAWFALTGTLNWP